MSAPLTSAEETDEDLPRRRREARPLVVIKQPLYVPRTEVA